MKLPLIRSLKLVRPIPPEITPEMKHLGLMWAYSTDGHWIEVCDFCGGNCGQCGLTSRIGNVPFNFNRIVDHHGK